MEIKIFHIIRGIAIKWIIPTRLANLNPMFTLSPGIKGNPIESAWNKLKALVIVEEYCC